MGCFLEPFVLTGHRMESFLYSQLYSKLGF
jgi:hypothetical protein